MEKVFKNGNRKRLLKNTAFLYILTFSSYLLSLILVPYETRVLGVEYFGLIGLAAAIMAYFQLFIDFGFLLSATEEVSAQREDKGCLSKIFTSVTINKLILSVLSAIVLFILCKSIDRWGEYTLFLMLSLLASVTNSLLPDYLYRGMENMKTITIRTVLIKTAFTLLVFLFVKDSSDYLMIPILQTSGNAVALLGTYFHLYKKVKVWFCRCRLFDIIYRLKKSAFFFFSRIATTVYTATNTIVLDFISRGGLTAFYTSADKLVSTAKSGLAPVSDSLYPYMVKHKDFKIVKTVLLIIEPIVLLGCTIVFIWAEPLCVWFFGVDYAPTANILRALLPVVVVILPSYIFGFPMLGAMGLNKHANYSTIVGSILHILQLLILYLIGKLSIITLGITTSITESVILLYRIAIVIKNRHLLKKREE
ncbi:MAG: oligosaccharide flippase family protein [Clostridia bacterium]|nr:oligosaccharide flippase family protein [Clostridia bacterium]